MKYPKDYSQKDIREFYQEAIDVVRKNGKATASLLQRRFTIGYAKSAMLLDMMREDKIIEEWSPTRESKVIG